MIDGTVKKPFVNFNYINQRIAIGKDQGYIDEEEYVKGLINEHS